MHNLIGLSASPRAPFLEINWDLKRWAQLLIPEPSFFWFEAPCFYSPRASCPSVFEPEWSFRGPFRKEGTDQFRAARLKEPGLETSWKASGLFLGGPTLASKWAALGYSGPLFWAGFPGRLLWVRLFFSSKGARQGLRCSEVCHEPRHLRDHER